MALTEVNSPSAIFDPARATKTFDDDRREALERLPRLHREAARNLRLSQFLGNSPLVCVALMLAGGIALAWASVSGGGSLKSDFTWAALVLLGVIAMTRTFIRGYARSLRRVPLDEAAADLRALLLYTGTAWGAGAFLVMPALPAPALVFSFAAAPSLAASLMLRDGKGVAAFVAPASLIPAAAALLGAWPLDGWVAGAITSAAGLLLALPIFPRGMRSNPCPAR